MTKNLMEYAKMQTRRIAIEGEWFTIQFFKEGDGTVRTELSHNITGKFYKMYPDNKITFEEK